MRLSRFINEHTEDILTEWDAFARTLEPAANAMPDLALRDHAKQILKAIALDIESWQDAELQLQKSQGTAPENRLQQSAASIHGALRQASNFSLLQLSAEYRALRATVLRLWLPRVSSMSATTTQEVVRFNEAIDQALSESVVTYSARADHARDLLLAVLGHDLRSPLATMTMAGALLRHAEPEQVALIGTRVRRSAALMSSMVDDLLGFSQSQLVKGMPITLDAVDIKEICESEIEDASATHPDCRFVFEAAGDLKGFFDGVRLHQLVANLLVNAAQYGVSERSVIVNARGELDSVLVQVTNFGPAIPADSLQSIFQPLIQLSQGAESDARPRTSLGLGLFVAREIATAHGGEISVESSELDGTTFTVRLPRKLN
jgi:signal transduction histidine kinase